MKLSELINALQELDEYGDVEVCVGTKPVWYVDLLPAYYDGKLQTIDRNANKAKYHVEGYKVLLVTDSIENAIVNEDPDNPLQIDYSELGSKAEYYRECDESLRKFYKSIRSDGRNARELRFFIMWLEKKSERYKFDKDNIELLAKRFFDRNKMSAENEFLKEDSEYGEMNYLQRRESDWDVLFEVHCDNGFLDIRKKS